MLHHGRRGILGKGASTESEAIAVGPSNATMIAVYKWSASGFGTRYTTGAPLDGTSGIAFSPTGDVIAYAGSTLPRVHAYAWSPVIGFGTKYADPVTATGSEGYDVDFHPSGGSIAVAHRNSPYISAYPWSTATGFGAKYTNPAVLANGAPLSVRFSPTGGAVFLAGVNNTSLYAYAWNQTTGFGTRYTTPAGVSFDKATFSTSGNAAAFPNAGTPFISVYPWSDTTGFGTKYSNPTSLPSSRGHSVAFSPTDNAVVVTTTSSPWIAAYAWNSTTGFGARYANPTTLPDNGSTGNLWGGPLFSSDGNALFVTLEVSPYIIAYPWNSTTGFGTPYANPASLPVASSYSRPAFRKIPV